jgi:hypothetical protein
MPENPNPAPQPSPSAPTPAAQPNGQAVQYFASICPGIDSPLPDAAKPFANAVLEYEAVTEKPSFVLLQKDVSDHDDDYISDGLCEKIAESKAQLVASNGITLILHTGGGNPHAGYRMAVLLQKSGGFDVLIPRMAKSAGTLLSLGARRIVMGEMAEIGPLDMQVKDEETELWDSALNETKSLQTLSREALILYSSKMELLKMMQEGKSFQTRNRIATEFVNEMIRPLVEKIDAVHYTKMARIMEIMKAYGRELMRRSGYPLPRAFRAVDALGDNFPDHGYIIDAREAKELGLRVESAKQNLLPQVETMFKACGNIRVIGRITSSQQPTS